MENINILGINISNIDKKTVLRKIEQFLTDGKQHYIVTPNPEIILESRKSEEFFHILNSADISIPDGIGLKFAAWMMGRNINRITGADLTEDILKMAEEKNLKVAIFNLKRGLSDEIDIRNMLKEKYPKLSFAIEEIDKEWEMPYYQKINIFKPDMIFVTLGAPYQEKFIYHQLPKMPYIKLGIGVGGAFDFLTGKVKRAPGLMRVIGLEWLWRLIRQPKKRSGRIYNAVMVFPWKIIKARFIYPFFYRPNVACFLFKKEGDARKVLIVERGHERGHWQLPQGGTDGEDIRTAGVRELSEELNTTALKPVAVFRNVHKYKFGDCLGKFDTDKKSALGFKGQKQGLLIAEFIGKDDDIKVNFWDHSDWKWVNVDDFPDSVSPIRKVSAEKFLEKFNEVFDKKE